jgi:hypothetical protein
MTVFRMDVHRQSGEVRLWVETPCGFKRIMEWADLEGVKEFAEMLLSFYNSLLPNTVSEMISISFRSYFQAEGGLSRPKIY